MGDNWFPYYVSIVMGVYPQMDGLFHGNSQSKMDDSGVPLFRESRRWWLNGDWTKKIGDFMNQVMVF